MATHLSNRAQSNKSQSKKVGAPIIIAAIVFLVIFVSGLAYYFLGSHTESVHPRPLTTSESWLQKKARESGGDYNKLSPEDQQQLFSIAGPSGPVTLRSTYEAQRAR